MSDEPKIEGVPEGYRIVRVRKMNEAYSDPYYEAILERIPEPKELVLVAEWSNLGWVGNESRIEPVLAVINGVIYPASTFRIEERDA